MTAPTGTATLQRGLEDQRPPRRSPPPRSYRVIALRTLLLACGIAVLAAFAPAQTVRCLLGSRQIFVGQKTNYQILVRDAREAALEAVPEVAGLVITKVQEGTINESSRVTIVNGRMSQEQSADYAITFEVVASAPGTYTIPPAFVSVGGRRLGGNAVTLVVEAASAQDLAYVEASVDQEKIVRGEMIHVAVDVFLKHLPPPSPTPDPLSQHDRGGLFDASVPAPELALPWLPTPPLGLGGFEAEAWLKARLARDGGLRFAAWPRNRFAGETSDVERTLADGKKAKYRRYRFAVEFRADTVGRYEFPAATLEGKLVQKNVDGFQWRDIFAKSGALSVTVEEPPEAARPTSFRGAVGNFRFSLAPPTPTDVVVGDPIYLTLVVEGEGNMQGVELDLAAQLGERFRVDAPRVIDSLRKGDERPAGFPDRPGTWRQFEAKVRPLEAGITEIPAIEFSWFDTRKRAYERASVGPVPIAVRAPKSDAELVVPKGAGPAAAVELVPTSALSGNVDDLNLLANQKPKPLVPTLVLAGLIPAYALLSFVVRRRRALAADPALLRRRRAATRAEERLAVASGKAASEPGAALVLAFDAFRGFVADLEAKDEEACTSGDLKAWAQSRGLTAELHEALESFCDAGELARFGGGRLGTEDVRRHLEVARGLVRAARSTAVASARGGTVSRALVFVLAGIAVAGTARSSRAQDLGRFRAAEAASLAGRHDEAAALFAAMLDEGYENGYVLYNLGNAHLRAGRLGAAIAAYRRAERFIPTDANLAVNLRKALERRNATLSPIERERTWLDFVFFWRRTLPFATVLRIALGLGLLAFALAALRILLPRPLVALRQTFFVVLVLAAVFAASAFVAWRELEARDHAVVTESKVVLRKWRGADAEPAYEQPLVEGTEATITERRDGWLRLRVADRYEGWLPESSAATY